MLNSAGQSWAWRYNTLQWRSGERYRLRNGAGSGTNKVTRCALARAGAHRECEPLPHLQLPFERSEAMHSSVSVALRCGLFRETA